MDIQNTVAVVTGGGSGLGEGTSRALTARGSKVAILDLGRSRGAELAHELGESARFLEADVTDEDQTAAAIDKTVAAFGTIHALINCAGIATAGRTLGKRRNVSPDRTEGDMFRPQGTPLALGPFRRTIEVNLIGTFNTIRLAAAQMAKNEPTADGERGVIINTASVAAFDGQIGQAAYSASKGGVVGMTLPIARDLARDGIRCCTIAPGIFETPMLMDLPEVARQSLGASIPFPQRLGTPAEYAALACHIVENVMLNGETIRLDGAIRMAPQ